MEKSENALLYLTEICGSSMGAAYGAAAFMEMEKQEEQ
jgi:hypothetical protein